MDGVEKRKVSRAVRVRFRKCGHPRVRSTIIRNKTGAARCRICFQAACEQVCREKRAIRDWVQPDWREQRQRKQQARLRKYQAELRGDHAARQAATPKAYAWGYLWEI
jgi:hypothetical protein